MKLSEFAVRVGRLKNDLMYEIRTGLHMDQLAQNQGVKKQVRLTHPSGSFVKYSHLPKRANSKYNRSEIDLIQTPENTPFDQGSEPLRGTPKGSTSIRRVGSYSLKHLLKNNHAVSYMPLATADAAKGVVSDTDSLDRHYHRIIKRLGGKVKKGDFMTRITPSGN